MAPVPEDNQDTPPSPNGDDSEHLSNPNLNIPVGGSDSSDSDDSEENNGAPSGYSLLPQDPDDENGFNSDDENIYSTDNVGDNFNNVLSASGAVIASGVDPDIHAESVLSSDEAKAPTVSTSNEHHHPAFLAKFTDGKIPTYMQVPKVPRDKDEHLWNQQRQESNKLSLDPVQESKIIKAMSEFSLPTENIPDWAKHLPDDQWQQQILSRIGIVSGRGKHSVNTKFSTPSDSCETKAETNNFVATDDTWVADFTDSTTS